MNRWNFLSYNEKSTFQLGNRDEPIFGFKVWVERYGRNGEGRRETREFRLKFAGRIFSISSNNSMKSGIVENNRRATLLSSSFLRKKNCSRSIYFSYSSYVNPSREGSWATLCHWQIFPEIERNNRTISSWKAFPNIFSYCIGNRENLSSRYSIFHYFSSTIKIFNFFQVFNGEKRSYFFQLWSNWKKFHFPPVLRSNTFFFSKRFKAAIFQFPSRYFFQRVERKEKKKTRIVSIVHHSQSKELKIVEFFTGRVERILLSFLCSANQLQLDLSINRGKTSLSNGWP